MATNTFKRLTKQNISNNSGSPSTIYTAATNKTSIVIGCLLCNKLSSQVTASVYIDTAISGNDDVFLVKESVGSRNFDDMNDGLKRMEISGVTLINFEMLLFELIRDSKSPDFKPLSRFIKK